MSTKLRSAVPNMKCDGEFMNPLPIEGYLHPEKSWYAGLNPWQRLNSHYTYSSVRRHVHFKPFEKMKDHLDYILNTTYQHNKELFPEQTDIYFQPKTLGLKAKISEGEIPSDDSSEHELERTVKYKAQSQFLKGLKAQREFILAHRVCPDHPLIISGVKERVHPSSVKLMNSSHHSPQTNAGYVRQDRDGTLFLY